MAGAGWAFSESYRRVNKATNTEESTKLPTHKHKAVISPRLHFSNYNTSRRAFNSGPASLLENDFIKDASSEILIGGFHVQVVLQRDIKK